MTKKANHQANIVRISEVLPHNNADTLELIRIGGYQVVVKKGQFVTGDLAVYIQPDSVVPQTGPFKFIWEQYQTEPDGEVPEKRRRITVRKFRGEWSEGLLMPWYEFPEIRNRTLTDDNADVSDLIGITHYDPDRGAESTKGSTMKGPRSRWPRSFKGWVFFILHKLRIIRSDIHGWDRESGLDLPVYDVHALKNYVHAFVFGEPVIVTEKIHGSNARFVFQNGKMYAGSRTLWKSPKSTCVWRKALKQNPWIEEWCRAHEGYALYGEVVPTQKGFKYGCKDGEVKFFVFDIRTPSGKWMELAGTTTVNGVTEVFYDEQGDNEHRWN